jgi:hypothetical protein
MVLSYDTPPTSTSNIVITPPKSLHFPPPKASSHTHTHTHLQIPLHHQHHPHHHHQFSNLSSPAVLPPADTNTQLNTNKQKQKQVGISSLYFPPNQLEMPPLAFAAPSSTLASNLSMAFRASLLAFLRYSSNLPSAFASSERALSAYLLRGLSVTVYIVYEEVVFPSSPLHPSPRSSIYHMGVGRLDWLVGKVRGMVSLRKCARRNGSIFWELEEKEGRLAAVSILAPVSVAHASPCFLACFSRPGSSAFTFAEALDMSAVGGAEISAYADWGSCAQ